MNLNEKGNAVISPLGIILIVVSPLISFLLCDILNICNDKPLTTAFMRIIFAGIVCCAAYKYTNKKLTVNTIIFLIILSGIVLRIGYTVYDGWNTGRGYDEGPFNGYGHLGYIMDYALKWKLPDSNNEQFYQPPLNYFLTAIMMRIGALINHTKNYADVLDYCEIVPCMASCSALITIQKIFDALRINRKYQTFPLAVAAFFPSYMFMGSRMNNDSLVAMFMILSVFFTIRWYYEQKTEWIIGIALSIGLAMMSKVSGATVAFFTGPVMLIVLYKNFKQKNSLAIIKQLVLFAVICFPLGLWYPIRNYVLFGQELNYVQRLPITSVVYSGDAPWYVRFFSMPIIRDLRTGIHYENQDKSIAMMITKSSVVAAFDFSNVPKFVRNTLYLLNLFIIITSLVAMLLVCLKDKQRDLFSRFSMAALWIIIFGSFIMFNISYPYICTADVRYIPLTTVTGISYIGMFFQMYADNAHMQKFIKATKISIIAYCIMVIIMHT